MSSEERHPIYSVHSIRRGHRHHDHHDRGPNRDHKSVADRVVTWLFRRIYNDREVDAGILTVCIGLWIGCFSGTLTLHAWWAEVFNVLPPWVWMSMLVSAGGARIILGALHHQDRKLAAAAGVSSFIFAFMGCLTALIDYRMTVTPIFFWLAFSAIKSHVRIMLHNKSSLERRA